MMRDSLQVTATTQPLQVVSTVILGVLAMAASVAFSESGSSGSSEPAQPRHYMFVDGDIVCYRTVIGPEVPWDTGLVLLAEAVKKLNARFKSGEVDSAWISDELYQELEEAALLEATSRLWAWSRRFGMDLIELAELDDQVWSPFHLLDPPQDAARTAALSNGNRMEVTFCSTPPVPVTRDWQ